MPKKVYTWGKVQAGDIISFRYKGKKPTGTLTTLLVFNPKLPYVKKDGTKTFHLVGLKLEDRGTIPMIKSKPMLVQLLERVGDIEVVSGDDQIYRIEIKNVGVRGVKKQTYTKLRQQKTTIATSTTPVASNFDSFASIIGHLASDKND